MGRLTDTAREAFDLNKRKRNQVPWWLPRLGMVLLGVLALWAFVGRLGGGDEPVAAPPRQPSVVADPGGASEPGEQSAQAALDALYQAALDQGRGEPGEGEPVASGGVEMLLDSGGTATVPQQALDAATRQFAGVPQLVVRDVKVRTSSTERVEFTVTVDPDGAGALPGQLRQAVAVLQSGVWVAQGG